MKRPLADALCGILQGGVDAFFPAGIIDGRCQMIVEIVIQLHQRPDVLLGAAPDGEFHLVSPPLL